MKNFTNKLCVITGGSSGIGLAVAESLARQGARLLLVARGAEELERAADHLRQLGAASVDTLSADISQEADVARLAPMIARLGGAADLVVNSAGIVSGGQLDDTPLAEWERLHAVNVLGLVRVLQAVLPAMRARARAGGPGGHIVNIASGAGLVGFPGLSAYGATKAAVVSLSQSLRAELAGLNIGVTALCPGFVQTPIAHKLELFGRMNTPATRRLIERWFQFNNLQAGTVARACLRGVRRNQAVVVVGRDVRSGYWTQRLTPGLLDGLLARVSPRGSGRRPASIADPVPRS